MSPQVKVTKKVPANHHGANQVVLGHFKRPQKAKKAQKCKKNVEFLVLHVRVEKHTEDDVMNLISQKKKTTKLDSLRWNVTRSKNRWKDLFIGSLWRKNSVHVCFIFGNSGR